VSRQVILSHSPQETSDLGRLLGAILPTGFFIALQGELGGGKTCFTRGLVAAVSPESSHMVASPTFAIMNEYPGQTPIYHFDFYRLTSPHEIVELGFEDYFTANGICIAEWSERLENMLPIDHLRITFEHAGDDLRKITLEAVSPAGISILEDFKNKNS
jgi:tRNA threonylcarbamoyladenosine biosynthesis protein TsaE